MALKSSASLSNSLKLVKPTVMLGRRVDQVDNDLGSASESNFEIERGLVSPTNSSASTEVPDDYEPSDDLKSVAKWPIPVYSKNGRKLKRPVNKRLTYPKVKITRRRTPNTMKRNAKQTPKVLEVSAPATLSPIAKTPTPRVTKGKVSPLVPHLFIPPAEILTKLRPLWADSVAEMSHGKKTALFGNGTSARESEVNPSSCGSSDSEVVITTSEKSKLQEVMKIAKAVVLSRERRATGNVEVITKKLVEGISFPDITAVVTARPLLPTPIKSLFVDDLVKRKLLVTTPKLWSSSATKPTNAVGQSQAIHRTDDDLKKSTSIKDTLQPLPSVEASLTSQLSYEKLSEIFQPVVPIWPKKPTVTAMLTYGTPLHAEQETPLNLSLEVANDSFPSFEPATTSKELSRNQNTIRTLAITSGRVSSATPGATEIDLLTRKVPTVKRLEPSAFTRNKTAKTNRNSNKNPEPGPSVRVVNGTSTFMRGREEVVVDAYPMLGVPKEKPKYDDNVPWICSFCHLQPFAQINLPFDRDGYGLLPHPYAMGDLFGPYVADLPPIYGDRRSGSQSSSKRETWMHGDCALWAGRLLLVHDTLMHLEEELLNADTEVCTICNKTGATISCCQRECTEGVHFPCAKWKGWQLKNYMGYCPKHCWNPMFK